MKIEGTGFVGIFLRGVWEGEKNKMKSDSKVSAWRSGRMALKIANTGRRKLRIYREPEV